MDSYILFLIIAIITVLSPGPGVVLTLSNAIGHGVSKALFSILGIAFGTFIVAGISATSLGVLLTTSSLAFNIIKYLGAAYLVYLAIKLWRTSSSKINLKETSSRNCYSLFLEGLIIQLTNPKAVFFFISVFPQFIDLKENYSSQFILLVVSYSLLVVLIHLFYAFLATSAKVWLSTPKGGKIVNRLASGTFMFFGIGLASASK